MSAGWRRRDGELAMSSGMSRHQAPSMSLRGYADYRKAHGLPGGSLRAVQEAIARGRIEAPGGRIDPTIADLSWTANTDSTRRPQTGRATPSTLSEAKRLESIERTRELRLKNDEREGRLVDVEE